MSTEAESSPPRGATAIVALAAPAHAPAQTAVIGAAAAADGAAFFFVPRAAAGPAATATAPPRAHRHGGIRTGRAPRLMT